MIKKHKLITRIQEEKILGRKPYKMVSTEAKQLYKDQTILVTGAAGSIGSYICREIIKLQIDTLIMYDHNESGLYDLYQNLLLQDNRDNKVIMVGDICNENSLELLFQSHKPDIVFHAAAYKHVPIMEQQPFEAVRTNILGTKLVASLSVKHDVKKFIFVSTDKAVNPSSILGATKRISELYLILQTNQKSSDCQFISCRFGNVLESNGSVVPLLKKQIKHGRSVTITHPEVTRFFMTISEATSFLLESAFIGNQGEILFFDMGEPIKILDIAKFLITSSNATDDVDIIYTGLRPGEKIHEEEILEQANSSSTSHPKIFKILTNYTILNLFQTNFALLEKHFQDHNELDMVKTMKLLLPEFKSKVSRFEALD